MPLPLSGDCRRLPPRPDRPERPERPETDGERPREGERDREWAGVRPRERLGPAPPAAAGAGDADAARCLPDRSGVRPRDRPPALASASSPETAPLEALELGSDALFPLLPLPFAAAAAPPAVPVFSSFSSSSEEEE